MALRPAAHVRAWQIVAGLAVLAVLFVISRQNYLLFHGLIELFAIAVAWSVFLLLWSARRLSSNDAFLSVGIAYLFVGILDLVHTLGYRGMGIFTESESANLATQLWISARGLEAVALVMFPLLVARRVRPWAVLVAYGGVTALLLAAVFGGDLFPDCFVEGEGLTPFKIGAEYAICAVLALAIGLLYRRRESLEAPVWRLMVAAMALIIAGELAFTLYADVYGLANMAGHMLKVVSFFLIYMALGQEICRRRHLASVAESEATLRQSLDGLALNVALLDDRSRIVFVNQAWREFAAANEGDAECVSVDVDYLEVCDRAAEAGDRLARRFADGLREVLSGARLHYELEYPCHSPQVERWFVGAAARIDGDGPTKAAVYHLDVTDRRRVEGDLRTSSELLEALRTAQSCYIQGEGPRKVFSTLLETLVALTGSEFGFLDELLHDDEGVPYKLSLAISDIAWDSESRVLLEQLRARNLEFRNLDNLAGLPAKLAEPVIAKDASRDARSGGLPPGHPPVHTYMGLPLVFGGQIVGVAGIANREGGYDDALARFIEPLLATTSSIIRAVRQESEQREVVRALRQSEERRRLSVRAARVGLWDLDLVRGLVWCDEGFERLLGACPEEIDESRNWWAERIHPGDRDRVAESLRSALEGGGDSWACDYRFRLADESYGDIQDRATIERGPRGDVLRVVGVMLDVTDVTTARRSEARSEEKFRIIFESTGVATCVVAGDGMIRECNGALAELTGFPRSEMVGKRKWTDFVAKADLDHLRRFEERCSAEDGAAPAQYECHIVDRTGHERTVVVNVAMHGEDRIVSLLDITDRQEAQEALRRSEERHRAILGTAMDGFWITDTSGRFLEVNETYCEMSGYSEQELLRMDIGAVEDVETPTDTAAHLRMVMARGQDRFESRHRRKDGSVFDVDVCVQYRPSDEPHLVAFLRDISDRVRSECALRDSEERFRLLAENTPGVIYSCRNDARRTLLYINRRVEQLTGYPYERFESNELSFADLYHPEDEEGVYEEVERALMSGEPFHLTYRLRHANGEWIWIEEFGVVICENGETASLQGVLYDISERRRAEDLVREKTARLQSFFELPHVGLAITSTEKGWLEVSPGLCQMLGFTADELKSMSWSDITHPHDLDADVAQFNRVLSGEIDTYAMDKRFFRKDGEVIWVLLSLACVRRPDGSVDYLTALLHEITDRKRFEAALEKRMVALTRPLDSAEGVTFEELFNPDDIQRLQDQFAAATGVASIITGIDGVPITRPSNFCRLCREIISRTDKGRARCFRSDGRMRKVNPDGPNIQTCSSCGLWDAGAGISVGGRHIANWMIGQVRDGTPSDEMMRAHAREIGADEEAFIAAFHEVPVMSREKFDEVAQALCTLANHLSDAAYQNVHQARSIAEIEKAQRALKNSERRLRLALDAAQAGTWVYDVARDEGLWDDRMQQIFGFAPGEFDGTFRAWRERVHPDDRSGAEERTREALRTGSRYEFTYRLAIPEEDGIWRTVHALANVTSNADGDAERMVGMCIDVTDLKRTELALIESNRTMRLAAESAEIGIWRLDLDADRLEWDDRMFLIHGLDREEFGGAYSDWRSRVHPDDRERATEHVQRALDGESDFHTEFRIVRPDGQTRHLSGHAIVSRDDRGRPSHMTGINYDITDRVRALAALKDSEVRFRALHNASFGGIAIHHQGVILECNRGLSEITGYSYEELIGMDLLRLFSDETGDRVIRSIESGTEEAHEATGERRNGERYPVRLEARNIPFKGMTARVIEFRDITAIKQAEAEREKLQAQLTQAQKMESVGRLAGGVAHDFNNMLGVILGHTDMLLSDVSPDQRIHADIEEIRTAAKRSAGLTRQLLAFARQQPAAPKVLDLNATVESMITMLRRIIGEDIELTWLPSASALPVRIDPTQIDQILVNLCVNARDAIAGPGEITIESAGVVLGEGDVLALGVPEPGDYVMLVVRDNGCGLDAGHRDRIFEPFFTTKERDKGTGLGLATVYGVVQQNNGLIDVESEPGHGTSFRIYLPRHAVEAAETEEAEQRKAADPGHETILLVEDEPAMLAVIVHMLERSGYRVIRAGTPSEAIRLASEHSGRIHLLLTDVIMPEMNGRELADRILSRRPELRCLYMSGYTANILAPHGILDEPVQLIQKPFSRHDLAAKVRAVLDRE